MAITSGEMLASVPADILASFAELPSDLPAIAHEPESNVGRRQLPVRLEDLDMGEPLKADSAMIPEPDDEAVTAAEPATPETPVAEDLPEGVTKFTDNKGGRSIRSKKPATRTFTGITSSFRPHNS